VQLNKNTVAPLQVYKSEALGIPKNKALLLKDAEKTDLDEEPKKKKKGEEDEKELVYINHGWEFREKK